MNVLIAGNRRVPISAVATPLAKQLASLPMETTILLRRGAHQKRTQPFERLASEVASDLGMRVSWIEPEGPGRGASWSRDWAMVHAADKVILYLHEGYPDGGTEHLLSCALMDEPHVEAYTLVEDGAEQVLAWLGDT